MNTIFGLLTAILTFLAGWLIFSNKKKPTYQKPTDEPDNLEELEETVIYVEPIVPIATGAGAVPEEEEQSQEPEETTQPPKEEKAMASFEIAYQVVKRNEGGYQNFANDPGNFNSRGEQVGTNWGINAKVYEEHIGRPPTVADMRAMTKETAKQIYRNSYWRRIQGDKIEDQQVATILFDGHVNHGFWGIKMIQQVLGVGADGIVGPVTLAAINNAIPFDLFERYKNRRIEFYHHFANNVRPDMKDTWLRPWLNRMAAFTYSTSNSQAYSAAGKKGNGTLGLIVAFAVAASYLS